MKTINLILLSLALVCCQSNSDVSQKDQTQTKTSDQTAESKTKQAQKTKKEVSKAATLKVSMPGLTAQAPIPAQYAFCIEDGKGKGTFGKNESPQIKWEGAPAGTKSFAVITHDPDVPSKGDNVNKDGKSVSKDLPRVDFFHWVLVDIPAATTELAVGADGKEVKAGGKTPGKSAHGVRGLNNYTDWFASNEKMKGKYGGYDGPCPPWNDEIVHHYHFTVYALDVPSLNLKGDFKGPEALKAMEGHILAQGSFVGLYKLNTKVNY